MDHHLLGILFVAFAGCATSDAQPTVDDIDMARGSCSYNCGANEAEMATHYNPAGSVSLDISCCNDASCTSTTPVCSLTCGSGAIQVSDNTGTSGTATCAQPQPAPSQSSAN